MQEIVLNGQWELAYCDLGSGSVSDFRGEGSREVEWIPAIVPGDVHLDLIRGGIIPEPLIGTNTAKCLWIEEKEWWYRKRFLVSDSFSDREVKLVFDGLDLTADIWLNGHYLGQHSNMFVPWEEAVGHLLSTGENELIVRLDVGLASVRNRETAKYYSSWNPEETARVWLRKSQFVFGWDWAPRLATCGIWRAVRLESYQHAHIADFHVRNAVPSPTKAEISVEVVIEGVTDKKTGELLLELTDGTTSLSHSQPVALSSKQTQYQLSLAVPKPKLWWPNGMGEPHLYTLSVALLNSFGQELDRKTCKHGIRTVALDESPTPGGGNAFRLIVNGEPVYVKGANWVPADSILARVSKKKYNNLVGLAAKANFNMLRVWGGGIYESDDFFSACDFNGIMVWHDFMFACAYYPCDNDGFCREIEREAVAVVKRLRNYTSLVMWCGNNENQFMYASEPTANDPRPFFGEKIYNKLLPQACVSYDGTRPYRPGSPFGGDNPNAPNSGDQHCWEHSLRDHLPQWLDFWDYPTEPNQFVSEFGILSPPNLSTVREYFMHNEVQVDSDLWRFHTNTYDRIGYIDKMIERYYGPPQALSVDKYIRVGQMIQAEALRHILEQWRLRKWQNSGSLLWMYTDCWGTVSWTQSITISNPRLATTT